MAEELKVGSRVIIANRYNSSIATITGETAKFWKVGADRLFDKIRLKLRGGDPFMGSRIRLATQADIDSIERERLANRLSSFKFHNLPLETLKKIEGLLP